MKWVTSRRAILPPFEVPPKDKTLIKYLLINLIHSTYLCLLNLKLERPSSLYNSLRFINPNFNSPHQFHSPHPPLPHYANAYPPSQYHHPIYPSPFLSQNLMLKL